jgi:hypothetical protein
MRQPGWVYWSTLAALGLALTPLGCGDTKKDAHPATPDASAGTSSGGKSGQAGSANQGGSTNPTGGSANRATDLDTFLEQQGQGFCARLFRCLEANDDFLGERLVIENAPACEELLARVNATSRSMRDLRAEVAAGNLHYVPDQGQACLAELSACNGIDSLGDGSCREAFDGNAKTGEACHRSEDCAGDAYCALGGACPGTCAPRKPAGAACEFDMECAFTTGLVFCENESGVTGTCRTLEKAQPAAKGEPCTRNLEGAASLILCQDGLWCATLSGGDPVADVLGECALPIPLNMPCVDGDDVCDGGLCDTGSHLCRSVTLRKEAGQTCDEDAFTYCGPLQGLRCGPDGTCQGSGDGSQGSACFSSDLQRGCDAGLYCAKAAGTTSADPGQCQPFLADNAACNSSSDCLNGNCENDVCGGRGCLY